MSKTKTIEYMLIAVKSEATYDTDPWGGSDPDAGDWIAAYKDSNIESVRQIVENDTIRPFASGVEHESYGSHCNVTINIPLYGKESSAGDPPQGLSALYKAAGLGETINAGVSAVYAPETFHTIANAPSCAIYVAEYLTDGDVRTHLVTGVRFNEFSLTAADGQHARHSFQGMGTYSEEDAAAVSAPSNPASYSAGKSPLLSQGMSFTVDATAFPITDFELLLNWSLEEDRDLTGSSSLDGVDLVRGDAQRVNASINFRGSAEAETALGLVRGDSAAAIEAGFGDGTDSVDIEIPNGQLANYEKSRGVVFSFAVGIMANANSSDGNDEATLTFT